MARIVESGEIQVGDSIEIIQYGVQIEQTITPRTKCHPTIEEEHHDNKTFTR